MEVKFRKLNAIAKVPTYGTDGAAGADLRSVETVAVLSGKTKLVPTGLSVAIPNGYVGLLFPRSGLSVKTGLRMANSVGVIDSDYRGEIRCAFTNVGPYPETIESGDRIAQMVVVPFVKCEWTETDVLDDTDRGDGGFGSTGVK